MAEQRIVGWRCPHVNDEDTWDCPDAVPIYSNTLVGQAVELRKAVRSLIDTVLSDTWIGRRIRRYWPE